MDLQGLLPGLKGIQPRDPVSPFPFVLVGEALSRTIEAASFADLFEGFVMGRNATVVNLFQFFVDVLGPPRMHLHYTLMPS